MCKSLEEAKRLAALIRAERVINAAKEDAFSILAGAPKKGAFTRQNKLARDEKHNAKGVRVRFNECKGERSRKKPSTTGSFHVNPRLTGMWGNRKQLAFARAERVYPCNANINR